MGSFSLWTFLPDGSGSDCLPQQVLQSRTARSHKVSCTVHCKLPNLGEGVCCVEPVMLCVCCDSLQALPLGIARSHKGFVIGCTNSTVQCYNLKGKRSFCINLPSPILAMHGLEVAQQRIAKCLFLSLANGDALCCVQRCPDCRPVLSAQMCRGKRHLHIGTTTFSAGHLHRLLSRLSMCNVCAAMSCQCVLSARAKDWL